MVVLTFDCLGQCPSLVGLSALTEVQARQSGEPRSGEPPIFY